jgi:hypothetical protein
VASGRGPADAPGALGSSSGGLKSAVALPKALVLISCHRDNQLCHLDSVQRARRRGCAWSALSADHRYHRCMTGARDDKVQIFRRAASCIGVPVCVRQRARDSNLRFSRTQFAVANTFTPASSARSSGGRAAATANDPQHTGRTSQSCVNLYRCHSRRRTQLSAQSGHSPRRLGRLQVRSGHKTALDAKQR